METPIDCPYIKETEVPEKFMMLSISIEDDGKYRIL